MRQKLTIILTLIGMLFALDVSALGLSHIQVNSKLNEPLRAKIKVLSSVPNEVSNLKVKLASARAFRRAGLARSHVLTRVRFSVKPTGKTTAIIRLSTSQPVKEPFLNFLIEVKWPGGRILREYTTLLDPPLYKPASVRKLSRRAAKRKSKRVSTKKSRRQKSNKKTRKKTSRKTRKKTSRSRKKTSRKTRKKTSRSRKKTSKSSRQRATSKAGGGSYRIKRNDTLWYIAKRTRPRGVSAARHMKNIYRANPHAFIRGNRNLLKAGKVLRIPGKKNVRIEARSIPSRTRTRKSTRKSTSRAPQTRAHHKVKPSVKKVPERKVVLHTPDSPEETKGNVRASQEGESSAAFKKLQSRLNQLEEKVSTLESENKELKGQKTRASDLKAAMKKQTSEIGKLTELLELQNRNLADLRSQLKRQANENQRLKEQLAELQSSPPRDKLAFSPPQPIKTPLPV